jgi:hypothetical protein
MESSDSQVKSAERQNGRKGSYSADFLGGVPANRKLSYPGLLLAKKSRLSGCILRVAETAQAHASQASRVLLISITAAETQSHDFRLLRRPLPGCPLPGSDRQVTVTSRSLHGLDFPSYW